MCALGALVNAVMAHFFAQGTAAPAKDLRCLGLVMIAVFEGSLDQWLFNLAQNQRMQV